MQVIKATNLSEAVEMISLKKTPVIELSFDLSCDDFFKIGSLCLDYNGEVMRTGGFFIFVFKNFT